MIVYDIVMDVAPGAVCSYPRGRSLVDHRATEDAAQATAETYNRHCRVDGVRYSVVAIDECDPARQYDN